MATRVLLATLLVGAIAWLDLPAAAPQRGSLLSAAGVPQDPAALGYLNLHKRHPDGADGPEEFNTGFSRETALQRLSQMQGFLASFARLTDRVRGKLPRTELTAIGNTAPDMQTIGFHNIPLVVEGTLLKQDYQLRQAEYALALLKQERGAATVRDVDDARKAYADATKRFQVFWDTKRPTD